MKLTSTQTAALTAAAARSDGAILPLPAHIRGGAIVKVCAASVVKGLAINVGLADTQTLVISDDSRRALGHEVKPAAVTEIKAPQGRAGTKHARLVAMLKAPEGASVEEIVAIFGWQPHTVRGAIAGALKRGSACRSHLRRSRVADASTASCLDRTNSNKLPRIESQLPSRLTRDDGTRSKLVADGAPVPDGRLFDIAFFASADEAIAAAAACAHYLEKMPADEKGWHSFPAKKSCDCCLPT